MAMLRRMIKAGGRRAADGDEPELRALIELSGVLDEAIGAAVDGQRELGRSWAAIAAATGTSRQAAQQRWGRRATA
ncbi:hypothetical protein [Agromyces sp. S2-1-8]|uniref:hypothetical protein n=1 Tax=Agromyces sp. S2-1-8 TaxID=2897180 RepID=UPI001E3C142D|nr:hypothetical protein [Agromyces sp. S2-1-8]MCD5345044.1 hypothetical protein [Agromyces sp. S2-1-8]